MSAITFDTLAYSKKLRSAGFTEQQAEIVAEAQKESIEIVVSEIEIRQKYGKSIQYFRMEGNTNDAGCSEDDGAKDTLKQKTKLFQKRKIA